MNKPDPECPHCKVRMDEGFVPDRGRNSVAPAQWVQGIPERSFWQLLKMKDREKHTVVAYRCPRCGLLRLYAL
jgi:hypothetical protein